MKIRYQTGVGEAVFDVNRDGERVIITIDSRLSEEQACISACLSLDLRELSEFKALLSDVELALNGSHTG